MKNIIGLIDEQSRKICWSLLLILCLAFGSHANATSQQCELIEKSNINPDIVASMLDAAYRGHLYRVDSSASKIVFKVKHFPFSTVEGSFNEFEGGLSLTEENNYYDQALFVILVDSISTGDRVLDKYLKGSEFFDASQFPNIVFVSTGFEWIDETAARLSGLLTLRGITRPQEFIMQITTADNYHSVNDPSMTIHASAEIQRSEYGMDGLKLLVDDTVNFSIKIEASKIGS